MKISLQPKKLLLSKWTAVQVVAKQKHFIVSKVIQPESAALSDAPPELIEIEAVYTKRCVRFRGVSYRMSACGNGAGTETNAGSDCVLMCP
ncbi:TIGR02450 family Trp-rich protein [Undibacterium aquatile]